MRNKKLNRSENTHVGPNPIIQLWTNGNITIRQGAVKERINIRWIKPYHE